MKQGVAEKEHARPAGPLEVKPGRKTEAAADESENAPWPRFPHKAKTIKQLKIKLRMSSPSGPFDHKHQPRSSHRGRCAKELLQPV